MALAASPNHYLICLYLKCLTFTISLENHHRYGLYLFQRKIHGYFRIQINMVKTKVQCTTNVMHIEYRYKTVLKSDKNKGCPREYRTLRFERQYLMRG